MAVEHLAALEAFGIAIRAEIDASAIYTEIAARVDNPILRQRIDLFAGEESQHRHILEQAYQECFPEIPLELPHSRLPNPISCQALREMMSLKDILWCAIEEECRWHELYLKAAEQTTDPGGKMMYRFLADSEFSHKTALNAEYEMIARYPRYPGEDIKPWKPEPQR
jgi:rubrerythrin